MKKSLSVLLCLLLCLSIFAGCTPKEKPKAEGSVEISGVWKFNPAISRYEITENTLFYNREERVAAISFTSNGQHFSSIHWCHTAGTVVDVSLSFDETQVYGTTIVTDPLFIDYANWEHPEYAIIDFGAEPQTVNKDFYNWLTANASPMT